MAEWHHRLRALRWPSSSATRQDPLRAHRYTDTPGRAPIAILNSSRVGGFAPGRWTVMAAAAAAVCPNCSRTAGAKHFGSSGEKAQNQSYDQKSRPPGETGTGCPLCRGLALPFFRMAFSGTIGLMGTPIWSAPASPWVRPRLPLEQEAYQGNSLGSRFAG